MRLFLAILALWLAGGTAIAQVPAEELSQDQLFELLAGSTDADQARVYENQIWLNWFKSGDATIDEWMQQAMRQRKNYDFSGALKTLNRVIERDARYPEAWNQRAIVYFYQGDAEQSLQDIARALELEPRHFGSMAGRAMIRLQQGKPVIAMQNILQAVKLHPYLPERALFPGLETR